MTSSQRHQHAPVCNTAAQRALAVPEIAIAIFRCLKRDRIDLVALAPVCKRFRLIAIPLLLEELDMPLSRLPRFLETFRSERCRHFLPHVKYLRLWDDEIAREVRKSDPVHLEHAPEDWHHQSDEPPSGHTHVQDRRWSSQVAELFGMLDAAQHRTLPLIDLTFSIVSSVALAETFTRNARHAGRITAMHVLDHGLCEEDFPWLYPSVYPDEDGAGAAWWEDVTSFVQIITSAQDESHLSLLKVFSIEQGPEEQLVCAGRRTAHDLLQHLHPHLQELNLKLFASSFIVLHGSLSRSTLHHPWPRLSRLQLRLEENIPPWETNGGSLWADMAQSVYQFLARHTTLQQLDIAVPNMASSLAACRDMSGLQRFSIDEHELEWHEIHSIIEQNPSLIDIDLTSEGDWNSSSAPRTSPRHFQVYRGEPKELNRLLLAGHSFSCLYLRVEQEDCTEADALCERLGPAAAAKVTCLSLQPEGGYIDAPLAVDDFCESLGMRAARFPNLAELTVRDRHSKNTPVAKPAQRLCRLISAFHGMSKLRVLYIGHDCGEGLPDISELNTMLRDKVMPPCLQYIAWNLPHNATTQYLRVVCTTQGDGQVAQRLEYLPVSPYLRVDRDGVWNQAADAEAARTLLDHSVFPPHLLA